MFLLMALLVYSTPSARHPLRQRWLVGLFFLAGALAKPMLVTFPIVLVLCDIWPLGRVPISIATADDRQRWRGAVVEKWPLFFLAAGLGALTFLTQDRGGALLSPALIPLGVRVANACVSYAVYLRQTIWPVNLIVLYPYHLTVAVGSAAAALTALVMLTALAVRSGRRQPFITMGWLWFLFTLIPVIGLVQVGVQPHADRFTYVPSIGLLIVVAWTIHEAPHPRWRWLGWTGVLAATLLCAVLSRRQVWVWQDGITLWGHAVDVVAPSDAAAVEFELAKALLDRGLVGDAIFHFQTSVRVQPDAAVAQAALGVAFARANRPVEAKAAYLKALQLDPTMAEIQNNLGALLGAEGDVPGALTHFQAAVRLKPDFETARVNLGAALLTLGRREDAIREIRQALRETPADTKAQRLLGLALNGR